jgi:GNAT superfamily N-acetyltransferase
MPARIELLASHHDRAGFDCGEPALDDFLRRQAGQLQRRGFGKTYVAVGEDGAAVLGFVTVSVGQIAAVSMPPTLKLPRYPVPILRIGRLAVDHRQQGQGIGQDLLAFALHLALDFADRVGLWAVVVDAKHEAAAAWYQRLGFIATLDDPLCLILPIGTLGQVGSTI